MSSSGRLDPGSGGGGDGDDDLPTIDIRSLKDLAENEIVTGGGLTGIRWGLLVSTFLGTILLSFSYGLIDLINLIFAQITSIIDAVSLEIESLIRSSFDLFADPIGIAFRETAKSFGFLGPFAFPFSIILIIAIIGVVSTVVREVLADG